MDQAPSEMLNVVELLPIRKWLIAARPCTYRNMCYWNVRYVPDINCIDMLERKHLYSDTSCNKRKLIRTREENQFVSKLMSNLKKKYAKMCVSRIKFCIFNLYKVINYFRNVLDYFDTRIQWIRVSHMTKKEKTLKSRVFFRWFIVGRPHKIWLVRVFYEAAESAFESSHVYSWVDSNGERRVDALCTLTAPSSSICFLGPRQVISAMCTRKVPVELKSKKLRQLSVRKYWCVRDFAFGLYFWLLATAFLSMHKK